MLVNAVVFLAAIAVTVVEAEQAVPLAVDVQLAKAMALPDEFYHSSQFKQLRIQYFPLVVYSCQLLLQHYPLQKAS